MNSNAFKNIILYSIKNIYKNLIDNDKLKYNTLIGQINNTEIFFGHFIAYLNIQRVRLPRSSQQEFFKKSYNDLYEQFFDSIKLGAYNMKKTDYKTNINQNQNQKNIADVLLWEYLVKKEIKKNITEKKIKKKYNEMAKITREIIEIYAYDILVNFEKDAKKIIEELNNGKNFQELARKKSIGPAGPNGGILGWIQRGMMVAEFEEAAFKLEINTYTKIPVKTQFGWHIIYVTNKRNKEVPSIKKSRDDIIRI